MSTPTVEELESQFGVAGHLHFAEGPGGLVVARVDNGQAEAQIALSGGHVMTWAPRGEQPVLWLSGHARFATGKSIRGGVPVCWPWFGPHPTEAGFPGHGFARTQPWGVERVEVVREGVTRIGLVLQPDDAARAQWPHPSRLTSTLTVGRELVFELTTHNLGATPMVIGEALHTYFAVSDIRRAPILGLEGCTFLDKVEGNTRRRQEGPVVIDSEVDRVYVDTTADCVIEDAGLGRRVRVSKDGSRSTVVWNPWSAKADKMGDFGPDGYLGMVCVESGNALENVVTVPAGGAHTLVVRYSVEPLA
jgi:glucose-6-phosphate 1-epimerase